MLQAVLGQRVVIGVAEIELDQLLVVGRQAAGMGKELFDRDGFELGREVGDDRAEHIADGRRPGELPSSMSLAASVAVIALVSEPMWKRSSTETGMSALDSRANGASGDDHAILDHGTGKRREAVFDADRLEQIVEALLSAGG